MLLTILREPSETALTADRVNVAQPLDKTLGSIKESASGRDECTLEHNNGRVDRPLALQPGGRTTVQHRSMLSR